MPSSFLKPLLTLGLSGRVGVSILELRSKRESAVNGRDLSMKRILVLLASAVVWTDPESPDFGHSLNLQAVAPENALGIVGFVGDSTTA
jgi:hypothetical protein